MSSPPDFASWQLVFPAIGFVIFAAVFAVIVVRVLRMRRPTAERLVSLPLQEEQTRPGSDER